MTSLLHLENNDFTPDGRLLHSIHQGLPVFVMIQSSRCGHCINAKPEFAKLHRIVDGNGVRIMTILADGKREGEIALQNRIGRIVKGFNGSVPYFVLFLQNGDQVKYNGTRDASSWYAFLTKYTHSN